MRGGANTGRFHKKRVPDYIRGMNIALWLERAGKSHGELPAVALGARMVLDYGTLAERAARLAGALRGTLKLEAGDRVAIAARNCVEYVEAMFGIWHAGLAAVPTNAKLHGAELGYIIEHSGARLCLASPGLDAEIAPFAPAGLERLIALGSREYEGLFAADAMPVAERGPKRSSARIASSSYIGAPPKISVRRCLGSQSDFASTSRFTMVGAANIELPGQWPMSAKISLGSKPPDCGTTFTASRATCAII